MPRGQTDAERPRRIALAAMAVVAEHGVEGLTHRRVATQAGIPLGSTTYHFKTLDDLLAAAIAEAKTATDLELDKWSKSLEASVDLISALASYVYSTIEQSWERTVVELELYLAALRRPALRELSTGWDLELARQLSKHTDESSASVLALAVNGIYLQAAIHGMPTQQHIHQTLARIAR